jgi:hypothetical protein
VNRLSCTLGIKQGDKYFVPGLNWRHVCDEGFGTAGLCCVRERGGLEEMKTGQGISARDVLLLYRPWYSNWDHETRNGVDGVILAKNTSPELTHSNTRKKRTGVQTDKKQHSLVPTSSHVANLRATNNNKWC